MTALARSLVTRQELSASLRRPTDYDDAGSVADDGTDGDGATVAGGDIAVHAGTTGPAALTSTDEVLALVLAMLGTMTLASSEAAVTIATTREWQSFCVTNTNGETVAKLWRNADEALQLSRSVASALARSLVNAPHRTRRRSLPSWHKCTPTT